MKMLIKKEIKKILFQNIFIPLASGVASAFFIVAITYEITDSSQWIDHTDTVIQKIIDIQKLVSEAQAAARGYLLSGAKNDLFLMPFSNAQSEFETRSQELQELVSNSLYQTERAKDVRAVIVEWFEHTQGILKNAEIRPKAAIASFSTGIEEKKSTYIRSRLKEMLDDEIRVKGIRIAKRERFLRYAALFFLPFLLITSGFIAYRGRKSILQISDSYEEKISENINQLQVLEHDRWLREQESILSIKILKADTLSLVAKEILSYFSVNFNSVAGTMFVSQMGKNKTFWRVASLGLDDSKESLELFSSENSILAKVIESRKPEVFGHFSQSFWNLKSGLGTHTPLHVLAAPINYLGKCIAVLELAFNHKPEGRLLELLEIISEKLGGIISNELAKDVLIKLNQEIQHKSEELQAQQEELKISNEELEERAQLLKDSQAQLESKNIQLWETNDLLQSQTRNLEDQKARLDQRNQDLLKTRSEIEEKTRDLEKVSQYKSQFLANMSHELRTPLNSSMILAQLLVENKERSLSAKQVEYATQILKSGKDLLSLINDILDLSKVESGLLDLDITSFSPSEVLDSVRSSFRNIAEKKGIKLEIKGEGLLPTLISDRFRLQQILGNLVSNAVKFTEQGHVQLDVKEKSESDSERRVLFSVTDTGIGIPADKHDLIFEPFKQADGTVTRKYGGTGLGLAISKQLAGLLGGDITLRSEVGQGSVFTLEIPVKLDQPDGLEAKTTDLFSFRDEPSSTRGHLSKEMTAEAPVFNSILEDDRESSSGRPKILVVEDDVPFAKILRDHIQEKGFDCLVATSAQEGWSLALSNKPVSIVLDIGLPDYSGLLVLEKLKADLTLRHIPVSVVSVEDRFVQARRLGASQCLVKPLSLDKIQSLVFDLTHVAPKDFTKRILLIEGEPHRGPSLTSLLQSEQILLDSVHSGQAALAAISSTTKYDCLILDMKLPDISGFELLRRFSEEKLLHDGPPVIIRTETDLSRSEELELKHLTSTIILKSANSEEKLMNEVSIFLHQSLEQMPDHRQKILKQMNTQTKDLKNHKILLVDDDLRNVFSLTAALEERGAKVDMAQNGLEAIETLKKNKDYDVLLMDIMMPIMDGYEAIKIIRNELELKMLPIIALTAKAMKNDREVCLGAGANDYMAKPADISKLVSLIRVWTNKII